MAGVVNDSAGNQSLEKIAGDVRAEILTWLTDVKVISHQATILNGARPDLHRHRQT
jgi:hypothetical protein